MKKQELIEFHEKELEKYDSLAKTELESVRKMLVDLALYIEEEGYLNEYRLEKTMDRIKEYKNYKRQAGVTQSIISNLNMIE